MLSLIDLKDFLEINSALYQRQFGSVGQAQAIDAFLSRMAPRPMARVETAQRGA